MASASDNPDVSIRVMEEGLTCCICFNFLREPKELECPHIYCLQCLQKWVKNKSTIECPECRHITAVPNGGLLNLRTNLRLKNMVENYVEGTNITQNSSLVCSTHEGERQHFFCVTCDIAVCHNCLVLDHPRPQHEIKDLQVIVQSLKEKMDHVKTEMESIKKQQQKLSELEKKLMEQHASLVDQMDKLYPIKCSPSQAKMLSSKAELPSIDPLQISPVPSQHKSPQLDHVGASSKRTCKLTLLSEFGKYLLATAVAGTKTGQLAVVDLGKEVIIYRKYNKGYEHQYFLGSSRANGNILFPCALAVTLQGKFLVSDSGVVKVFSPGGKYEKSWPKSVIANVIKSTPDDMIVTGSRSTRVVITVHKSNGELIKKHQVGCGNIQSIATNGKQIAFTTLFPGKVHVIDLFTGQTLWTCALRYPGGICYEQKSNTILLAWSGSIKPGHDVIEQYCSTTGRLISRLASGLCSPMGMTVTHDSKLVVADGETVKVYQIAFE